MALCLGAISSIRLVVYVVGSYVFEAFGVFGVEGEGVYVPGLYRGYTGHFTIQTPQAIL